MLVGFDVVAGRAVGADVIDLGVDREVRFDFPAIAGHWHLLMRSFCLYIMIQGTVLGKVIPPLAGCGGRERPPYMTL